MSSILQLSLSRLLAPPWAGIFAKPGPVAIEIGPGVGEFLEAIATREPAWNFYAIERSDPRALTIQRRIDRKRLTNARVIRARAEFVLDLLPDECVDRFYIQFPDPWWKRRHHRRRLMTPELVAALQRVLRPGGTIEFVSDVDEYFALAQAALRADPGLEEIATDPQLLTSTSFSRKADARGWKLFAASHRKLGSA